MAPSYTLRCVQVGVPRWNRLFASLLFPLVVRDLRLRQAGKRPDRWYWADVWLMRLGFVAQPDFATAPAQQAHQG